jgi:hypothetical protein
MEPDDLLCSRNAREVSCMSRCYSPPLRAGPIGGAREIVSHLDTHGVEKIEGLAKEFGCRLCGDEGQFF